MRQLKKCLWYGRVNILDHIDMIHIERFAYSIPILRLLPLNHQIGSVSFRLYSSQNQSHCTTNLQSKQIYQIRCFKDIIPFKTYSTASDPKKELVENKSEQNASVSTSVIENVKETSKTLFWCGIIFVGLSFAVSVFYVITTELFSSSSPHRIYSKALKYVSNDSRVQNEMGDQLKGFGEETRRGRRQHVSHVEYTKDGKNHLRMKFYIKGNRGHGSVHLEMVQNDRGVYEYRYMFVVVDSDSNLYKKTIILEDNRSKYENDGKVGSALQDMDSLKDLDLSLK